MQMSTNIKIVAPILGAAAAAATVGAAYVVTKNVGKKGEVEVGKNEKQEQNVQKKGEEEVGKNEKQEQNVDKKRETDKDITVTAENSLENISNASIQ